MKIIDLSHSIQNGMQLYPGDPDIAIEQGLTHEKDYCHVDKVHLNSHTGTHIDAPFHFLKNGKRITDYPVNKFIGKGIAVDLTCKKEGEPIEISDLQDAPIEKNRIVLLATGWYRYFGKETYKNHPYLSKAAAEYLVKKGVSIVAVDFLNVDRTLYEAWDAHPELLGNDVLIVENINNSGALSFEKEYLFSFLPLKIKDSDGAPIRAAAIEIEDI